jgi:predicted RNA binding protein YcfA (HicA-like mRNA interferase family)
MSQFQKFLVSLLSGQSDRTIDFETLCNALKRLGFDERIRGSHHIFTKEGIEEIINIQPNGHIAKPYQVRQIRSILVHYHQGTTDEFDI